MVEIKRIIRISPTLEAKSKIICCSVRRSWASIKCGFQKLSNALVTVDIYAVINGDI